MNSLSVPQFVSTQTRRCLLCGRPSDYLGIFRPNHPEEFLPAAPPPAPGKQRLIACGLCERCRSVAGVFESIEDVIQRLGHAPLN